nr:MAG TPA: hypothetical protein [Caudoviricetes sp.]
MTFLPLCHIEMSLIPIITPWHGICIKFYVRDRNKHFKNKIKFKL